MSEANLQMRFDGSGGVSICTWFSDGVVPQHGCFGVVHRLLSGELWWHPQGAQKDRLGCDGPSSAWLKVEDTIVYQPWYQPLGKSMVEITLWYTMVEIGCVSTGPRGCDFLWALGHVALGPVAESSPLILLATFSQPQQLGPAFRRGCDPLYQHFYQDQMNKGQNAQASKHLETLLQCAVNNHWSCHMILYNMIQSDDIFSQCDISCDTSRYSFWSCFDLHDQNRFLMISPNTIIQIIHIYIYIYIDRIL